MALFFCGIDASFTGCAVSIIDESCNLIESNIFSTKPTHTEIDIELRVKELLNNVIFLLEKYLSDELYVCIEGLSFASKGQGFVQQAVLNYSIRMWLLDNNIKFKAPAPTSLKKFVCTGNAKKELMLKEVYKKWGMDFSNNDECDAYSLARICEDYYRNGKFK
jgi:crossover junction endodeoxyribonuclease RuvC